MKSVCYILFIIVVLHGCSSNSAMPVIPAVWVNANDNSFEQKQGILYLHQQPFSGYQFALYKNNDTAYVTPYNHGREWGLCRQWYSNRQLKEVRQYVNGKKDGLHKGWWENGAQQFVYHFTADFFDGSVQEWYANGAPFRKMNYKNGYENGLQQIWQPDGSLFANYEARNGRNYGLTGTMHCKNSVGVPPTEN